MNHWEGIQSSTGSKPLFGSLASARQTRSGSASNKQPAHPDDPRWDWPFLLRTCRVHDAIVSGKRRIHQRVRPHLSHGRETMRTPEFIGNKLFAWRFMDAGPTIRHPVRTKSSGMKIMRSSANPPTWDFDPFGDFDLIFGRQNWIAKSWIFRFATDEITYGTNQHFTLETDSFCCEWSLCARDKICLQHKDL